MYHFFVPKEQIDFENHRAYIEGGDYNHIRNVLRMHKGEEFSIGTGEDENEYRVELADYKEDRVLLNILFVKQAGVESPVFSVLYQGIPKGDKMETIIQKCVELGVSGIVPVSCARCVVKLNDKKAADKIARWQAIAEAAAKQSKRAIVPEIFRPMTMKQAIEAAEKDEIKIIPYELTMGMDGTKEIFEKLGTVVKNASRGTTIEGNTEGNTEENTEGHSEENTEGYSEGHTAGNSEEKESGKREKPRMSIFIGPEGGFTEEEVKSATECGIVPISLGRRILRTETAGMNVLAWVNYKLEVEEIT